MSSSPAVEIRDLRKSYRLTTSSATSVSEMVINRFKKDRKPVEILNALNGVNLTIERGEAVGIVGHNGAGKSTLLKILSRVTEPSAGQVRIRGRVGALLEVGTGFHPELTGRENVYLNGSILGMRRNEVRDRFDEIVDFSGVERFLDIPVKRYSSGMSVRLAFAVASSLSSDVLIVDEVLAVGDAEFQKKCLGRMAQVSSEGRTVLFVSHNLVAVQALCTRGILLKSGQVQLEGSPQDVVHAYLQGLVTSGAAGAPGVTELEVRPDGEKRPHLRRVELKRPDESPTNTLNTGGPAVFDIVVENMRELSLPHIGLSFWTETETLVATMTTQMSPAVPTGEPGDRRVYRLTLPRLPLLPGSYWVDVGVRVAGASEYIDLATRAFSVTVVGTDVYGSGVLPTEGEGVIYVEHSWHVR